jgi:hypothetical protein
MGFFSSLFSTPTSLGVRLADTCLEVRRDMQFLSSYVESRYESPAALIRLEFSKDVLMLFMAATVVETFIKDPLRRQQINEQMRSRYLSLLPVSPTCLVGDCIACDDELGPYVAPDASTSQLRTSIVSTKGLISLVVEYRQEEFRKDIVEGALSGSVYDLWTSVAKRFLKNIRGVPSWSIPEEDAIHLSAAIGTPFFIISETAKQFLR